MLMARGPVTVIFPADPLAETSLATSPNASGPEVVMFADARLICEPAPSAPTPAAGKPVADDTPPAVVIEVDPVDEMTPPALVGDKADRAVAGRGEGTGAGKICLSAWAGDGKGVGVLAEGGDGAAADAGDAAVLGDDAARAQAACGDRRVGQRHQATGGQTAGEVWAVDGAGGVIARYPSNHRTGTSHRSSR